MKTATELISEIEAMDFEDQDSFLNETLPCHILDEINTDSELPSADHLYCLWKNADDYGRELIEKTCIALTGWQFHTLIEQALIKHFFNVISKEQAFSEIKACHSVYALHDDGTESLIEIDDIQGSIAEARIKKILDDLESDGDQFGTEK